MKKSFVFAVLVGFFFITSFSGFTCEEQDKSGSVTNIYINTNDADGDGFTNFDDCNDDDPAINPAATEIMCDNIDQDCDGLIDDDQDSDGDGVTFCDGDCDDNNPNVYPSAEEICDGLDNNCDGQADGSCSLEINSLPDQDGNFHWVHGLDSYSLEKVTVSGHGYGEGIFTQPEISGIMGTTAFITFDLTAFNGDWDNITGSDLKVYLNPFTTFDNPPLPAPLSISVSLWVIDHRFDILEDCQIETVGSKRIHTPPGCEIPPTFVVGPFFELTPDGDGWYSLNENEQVNLKEFLRNYPRGNLGEMVTFSLYYDVFDYYILDEVPTYVQSLDETILAPPTLSIDYVE